MRRMALLAAAALLVGCTPVAVAQVNTDVPVLAPELTPPPVGPSLEELQKQEQWQQAISQIPLPKEGCFRVTYPSLEWQEVSCGATPSRRY
jgi:hypothetical protein